MTKTRMLLFIKFIKRGIHMGRYKQKSNGKGSLKLIQTLVNEYSHVLNSKLSHITGEQITWVSPLESDEYAEYRDTAFLEKLEVDAEVVKKLKDFWPRNGPQWDALGKFGDNGVLLVEAKANLPELVSPPSSPKPNITATHRTIIGGNKGIHRCYPGC